MKREPGPGLYQAGLIQQLARDSCEDAGGRDDLMVEQADLYCQGCKYVIPDGETCDDGVKVVWYLRCLCRLVGINRVMNRFHVTQQPDRRLVLPRFEWRLIINCSGNGAGSS